MQNPAILTVAPDSRYRVLTETLGGTVKLACEQRIQLKGHQGKENNQLVGGGKKDYRY